MKTPSRGRSKPRNNFKTVSGVSTFTNRSGYSEFDPIEEGWTSPDWLRHEHKKA